MCPVVQRCGCCCFLKSALVSCHTGSFFFFYRQHSSQVCEWETKALGNPLSEAAQFLLNEPGFHSWAFIALFSRRHGIGRVFSPGVLQASSFWFLQKIIKVGSTWTSEGPKHNGQARRQLCMRWSSFPSGGWTSWQSLKLSGRREGRQKEILISPAYC